jgi:2-dehydropantoate 2-reductase
MGAKLIQHGADEVVFVLRPSSSNVSALREGGLKYRAVEEGDEFDLAASACTVATLPELGSVGPVDAVILCVKTFQVASSIEDLAPLVGPDTVVISTQNGVEAHDTIAAVYGEERVLCGVVRVLSYIESADPTDGLVIRKNTPGSYHIGEIFPKVSADRRTDRQPDDDAFATALQRPLL